MVKRGGRGNIYFGGNRGDEDVEDIDAFKVVNQRLREFFKLIYAKHLRGLDAEEGSFMIEKDKINELLEVGFEKYGAKKERSDKIKKWFDSCFSAVNEGLLDDSAISPDIERPVRESLGDLRKYADIVYPNLSVVFNEYSWLELKKNLLWEDLIIGDESFLQVIIHLIELFNLFIVTENTQNFSFDEENEIIFFQGKKWVVLQEDVVDEGVEENVVGEDVGGESLKEFDDTKKSETPQTSDNGVVNVMETKKIRKNKKK